MFRPWCLQIKEPTLQESAEESCKIYTSGKSKICLRLRVYTLVLIALTNSTGGGTS